MWTGRELREGDRANGGLIGQDVEESHVIESNNDRGVEQRASHEEVEGAT